MDAADLVSKYPRLYHMTDVGNWTLIRRHGLRSTGGRLRRSRRFGPHHQCRGSSAGFRPRVHLANVARLIDGKSRGLRLPPPPSPPGLAWTARSRGGTEGGTIRASGAPPALLPRSTMRFTHGCGARSAPSGFGRPCKSDCSSTRGGHGGGISRSCLTLAPPTSPSKRVIATRPRKKRVNLRAWDEKSRTPPVRAPCAARRRGSSSTGCRRCKRWKGGFRRWRSHAIAAASSAGTARTRSTPKPKPPETRSASEQGPVVDLGVVAQGVQVMLGGHDLRVPEPLADLGERVALLAEERSAPLPQPRAGRSAASRSPYRPG